MENRQVFETPPTLAELRYFLLVILEELKTYKLWPANCWFFVSLLQQHLEGANEGHFVDGSLAWAKLAQDIRDRVKDRLRLFYHMPAPFTVGRWDDVFLAR